MSTIINKFQIALMGNDWCGLRSYSLETEDCIITVQTSQCYAAPENHWGCDSTSCPCPHDQLTYSEGIWDGSVYTDCVEIKPDGTGRYECNVEASSTSCHFGMSWGDWEAEFKSNLFDCSAYCGSAITLDLYEYH